MMRAIWKRIILLVTLTVLGSLVSGCQLGTPSKKSVIVIAVDSLGFNELPCGLRGENVAGLDGLMEFCQDSVRFTHAFTTSTMSQAALASVLTGFYPFEHGVWHNGNQFLSAEFTTVAEVAATEGFRTSFFSGGPPIWRRSGLNQGFERFDSNVKIKFRNLYRPAGEIVEAFDDWVADLGSKEAIFSFMYWADLQFPEIETVTDYKEVRSRTYNSQLREVSESLHLLMKKLRRRGRWNNTYIVLVGLNGRGMGPVRKEIKPTNLFTENTQVALLVKPAKKQRDLGIEWKIDRNVSLADLGKTLFDLVGGSAPTSRVSGFDVVSLKPSLIEPKTDWKERRTLVVESGWPQWRGVGGSRFSFRRRNFLYLIDSKVKIYNTLIDRLETSPISPKDPTWRDKYWEIEDTVNQFEISSWEPLTPTLLEKLRVGQKIWGYGEILDDHITRLKHLARVRPWDSQVASWEAHTAMRTKDWKWLRKVAERSDHRLWNFVAHQNLELPIKIKGRGCEALFFADPKTLKRPSPQECSDSLFLKLLGWVTATKREDRKYRKESFLRAYRAYRSDFYIATQNYAKGLHWSVEVDRPGEPTMTDLYLSLPSSRKYMRQVTRRLKL